MTSVVHTPLGGKPNTLVIDGRVEEDRAVLTARGELVHGCTDVLSTALEGLPAHVRRVDLDMTGVVFMDTAGLQFLERLGAFGRRREVPVRSRHWNGQPRRILELAGLNPDAPLRDAPHPVDGEAESPGASAVARERAEQLRELRTEVEQLKQAMASRPVIDQARGVLMAVHACTSEQAWEILREASQRSNIKLRAVAAAVTAGAEPDGPAPSEELRRALRTAVSHHLR
ncbi:MULTISPECIES: ANTAR domain-containing protein [Streptomyces]|uniref:ANTAR domain-containing protein n=1 Tax=Streptomyces TaxID=1883 RepID=UPI00201CE06B|nr:ANTAR domain-containing protein [Streptomyces panaciradicis]MCL6667272.1 ANTAR domain-containing protein [Streptomyces panaciradicis]